MTGAPLGQPRRPVERLVVSASAARVRRPPTPRRIAQRHLLIRLTKLVLPAVALALLALIALWPEFNRAVDQGRLAIKRMGQEVDGAVVVNARYRGVDEKDRPYTVTATTAKQVSPERVNLTDPKGDILQQNGSWLLLESKLGVFLQRANQLDLSKDVVLYRDDGAVFRTESAAIDLKNGAVASAEKVHGEGPFGTLDAQGFTVTDNGAIMQFPGPARLVMNAHSR